MNVFGSKVKTANLLVLVDPNLEIPSRLQPSNDFPV